MPMAGVSAEEKRLSGTVPVRFVSVVSAICHGIHMKARFYHIYI